MNNRYIRALDTNFDESFVDSIVFDKTLYKYAILGCKVNADGIMNEVFSPCSITHTSFREYPVQSTIIYLNTSCL